MINGHKPHIKLVRSYWEIHARRAPLTLPVALAQDLKRLSKRGPWTPEANRENYVGDARNPV